MGRPLCTDRQMYVFWQDAPLCGPGVGLPEGESKKSVQKKKKNIYCCLRLLTSWKMRVCGLKKINFLFDHILPGVSMLAECVTI